MVGRKVKPWRMKRNSLINIRLTKKERAEFQEIVDKSDFSNASAYIRDLIKKDSTGRLTLEYMIYENNTLLKEIIYILEEKND